MDDNKYGKEEGSMDEKFRKQLEENGTDVDTVLKRFMGNEALYMKFLMKFLDDKSYQSLLENIENRDFEEAFKSAHTLKGVTANLGIEPVCAAATRITDMLRNKKPEEVDTAQLDSYRVELVEAYGTFRKILEENRP